jgi:phosphoglycolate phosphatase-like HAD superfamily hydrolase
MKKIIVDVDNTLWDFGSVWYQRLKEINPHIPPLSSWKYDTPSKYVNSSDFHQTVDIIHATQSLYKPYPEAEEFLRKLSETFHITIATHRSKEHEDEIVKFLRDNNMRFNDIHCSYDKSVLFYNHDAIVDDAPHTLIKAREQNLVSTGLECSWNVHLKEIPLFENLLEILLFLNIMFD